MNKVFDFKKFLKYLISVALTVLVIMKIDLVADWISTVISVFSPLILGCAFAFILNLIMRRLERIYFPNSEKKFVKASRRPVCLVLSILIILLIAALVVGLVVPQLINTIAVIGDSIPFYVENLKEWISENSEKFPDVAQRITLILDNVGIDLNNFNWDSLVDTLGGFAKNGVSTIFTSTLSFIGSFTGSVVNAAIGLVFAIYILYNKEKLGRQIQSLMDCYLKEKWHRRINYFFSTAAGTFSSFISGQCTEAVILGVLCILGMTILQLPYATAIGTLVGVTALVPIVGAYIGAVVGALLIVVVEPIDAVIFIVFLIILQQIEGNVIYPKVVGSSIGLPGIWVLAAVTVGGGIGGIFGMLIGVPIAATAYKLISKDVSARKAAVAPQQDESAAQVSETDSDDKVQADTPQSIDNSEDNSNDGK